MQKKNNKKTHTHKEKEGNWGERKEENCIKLLF